MFTGLISDLSKVLSIRSEGASKRMEVSQAFPDLEMGESIAVNGVCLTVSSFAEGACFFDLGPETLAVSNLRNLRVADVVHLERALKVSDRLGGHFVSGHVDDTATLIAVTPIEGGGGWLELTFQDLASFARYIVPKGSICLDGVSLTVAQKTENSVRVMIIPHTWTQTCLGSYPVGQKLNVEYDMLAKFVWEQRKSLLNPE